ncbi:hypothetical protein AB0K51_14870 [Kitasatospora sp. NPDC049285]
MTSQFRQLAAPPEAPFAAGPRRPHTWSADALCNPPSAPRRA